MRYGKKLLCLVLLVCLAIVSTACSKEEKTVGYQLELPEKGEEIAVITTNYGTMKVRLFPEEAPKTVENFVTHAKNGYFDGQVFHRVIDNFMIQTGSNDGTGSGGVSIWGEKFEDEFSPNLFNIRGALAMANSGKNTNGSQFFINQAPASSFTGWDVYDANYEVFQQSDANVFHAYYPSGVLDMSKFTDDIKTLYEENGGNPSLDGYYNTNSRGHTVFGQVFEGLEVVDKIAGVETDANDRPVEDVIMEKVQIVEYEG